MLIRHAVCLVLLALLGAGCASAPPLDVTLRVDGEVVGQAQVPISAPLLFTANDCFDIGICLGSPVSLDYRERAPFPFEGHIHGVHVTYT